MSAWHRRMLHREGPGHRSRLHDRAHHDRRRRTASTSWRSCAGLDAERVMAGLRGCGRGIGPCESTCLDLQTGEEFVISSNKDVDLGDEQGVCELDALHRRRVAWWWLGFFVA